MWYHPPAGVRIIGKTQWERVRNLDWIGIILMAVGIVLFLMGLAFGGDKFPWVSAGTLVPIMVGVFSLVALGIWEWKFANEPFFAHELFIGQGRTFPLFLVITFVGGMSLYSAAAFWTQQVQGMWYRDPITIGLSSIPGGIGGAGKYSCSCYEVLEANDDSRWVSGWSFIGEVKVLFLASFVDVWSCHKMHRRWCFHYLHSCGFQASDGLVYSIASQ
jgi:membrane protein YdbS with pleckstrin-like domain